MKWFWADFERIESTGTQIYRGIGSFSLSLHTLTYTLRFRGNLFLEGRKQPENLEETQVGKQGEHENLYILSRNYFQWFFRAVIANHKMALFGSLWQFW